MKDSKIKYMHTNISLSFFPRPKHGSWHKKKGQMSLLLFINITLSSRTRHPSPSRNGSSLRLLSKHKPLKESRSVGSLASSWLFEPLLTFLRHSHSLLTAHPLMPRSTLLHRSFLSPLIIRNTSEWVKLRYSLPSLGSSQNSWYVFVITWNEKEMSGSAGKRHNIWNMICMKYNRYKTIKKT